jgi:hypothetical protein
MDGSGSLESQGSGELPPSQLRGVLDDAIRYWEPRRLAYNLVLALVVIAWVASTWPHFRGALTLESLLALVILAILANVCYCAAYLVDIPMQYSSFCVVWRRRRWLLWVVGMLFAVALSNYWIADEIYPYPNVR